MELSDSKSKKIASEAVKYLREIMIMNREITECDNKNVISFSSYTRLDCLCSKIMRHEDKLGFMKRPTHSVKVDDCSVSYFDLACFYKDNLEKEKLHLVVLEDKDIDELLGYVSESILKYGLCDNAFLVHTESSFIADTLKKLSDNLSKEREKEEEKKIMRVSYLAKLFSNTDIGFCKDIGGKIYTNTDNFVFKIVNHNNKCVCFFNSNGINEVEEVPNNDIYSIDKLYIEQLIKAKIEDKSMCRIPSFFILERNEEDRMIGIFNSSKLFQFFYGLQTEKLTYHILSENKLHDFLLYNNLEFLVKSYYTNDTLKKIANSYINYQSMSNDDLANMESIVEVAANWWVDVQRKGIYEENSSKRVAACRQVLANYVDDDNDINLRLNKFKDILKAEIKANLLYMNGGSFYLGGDGDDSQILFKASRKSGLSCPFRTTNMFISDNCVKVSEKYGESEVIYQRDEKDKPLQKVKS